MKWWKVMLVVWGIGLIACGYGLWLRKNSRVFVSGENIKTIREEVKPKSIKLAIAADIHDDWEEMRMAVEKMEDDGVELLLIAGDMTQNGTREELVKAKSELVKIGIKHALIPGNHDSWRFSNGVNVYDSIFESRYQTIRIEETKLILIDNSNYRGLGEVQWNWIEVEVAECQKILCLAVMHMPLNNSFSTHIMGENNKKTTVEAQKLLKLLVESGVARIEAGHLHYATSYELEGIRTDIVGAISREKNSQSPRYTELVISNDQVERRVVEVGL